MGVLSGCSDSSLTENSQNAANSIRFSVSAGKQTRAAVTDNNTVTGEHFGLYAYSTDNEWVAGTTNPTDEPDVMNDQMVEYDNQSNTWTYSPLKFWSDKKISFFGYWPKDMTLTNGSKVTEASIPNNQKLPSIKFTQEVTDPSKMVDFLVAHELNKTKASGTVTMPFRHALTRLNFQARLDDNWGTKITDNTKILVKSLKVLGGNDSRFFSSANYQLGDGGDAKDLVNGSWSYDGNDVQKVTTPLDVTGIMNTSSQTVGTTNPYPYPDNAVSVNLDGSNTSLLKPDEYLFLIPPYGSDGIKSDKDVIVEISYDVVTKDDNIHVNNGVVINPTTAQISLPEGKLVEGKAYNIIFTIGLDAIKVDADVTDWDADEAANAPAVNAASNSNADILAAWKSLNDNYKATDKNAKYFAINVPSAPTTDIDLSSVLESDIANFELGDQVELRFNGSTFSKTVLLPAGIGWSYQVRSTGSGTHYVLVKSDSPTVITENATANCYMINMAGKTTYLTFPLSQAKLGWDKIKTYDANQTTDIAAILQSGKWKIKTLWKTWSGTTSITGAKASNYTDAAPTATLTIPRTVRNGNNAVVALVSSDDESIVYWSWHLWFTDYVPISTDGSTINGQIHQYISDAFQSGIYVGKHMMDRNLGATITGVSGAINQPTTTTEAVKYYGLFYQFGRKDPFVGSSNGTNGTSFVRRNDANGTAITFKIVGDGSTVATESKVAYTVSNPLEFLIADGNWTTEDTGLWGEDGTKSVFDPCPPGWRVPIGGADAKNNPWAGFSNGTTSSTQSGNTYAKFTWQSAISNQLGTAGRLYDNTTKAWYPASGYLNSSSGLLSNVGTIGCYWSAMPYSQSKKQGLDLYVNISTVNPSNGSNRVNGFPVRCVQE